MTNALTIRRLKNTNFPELYQKLISGEILDDKQTTKLISLALAFINFKDSDINDLGYRIILFYSKTTHDYKPLYYISQNNGLIPIAKYIYETLEYGKEFGNIYTEVNDVQNLNYLHNGTYRTVEQKSLIEFSENNFNLSKVIVAPTSYGKTELIIGEIEKNKNKNICVVTPSKSLLAQTKRRILNSLGNIKIITQPEMYDEKKDTEIIAVLTQERLMRLLQQYENLKFNILIIDEAHNLLEKNSRYGNRSMLLASVIILCQSRNSSLQCNFLTPFLKSSDNLKIKYTNIDINNYIVSEKVKSELFYFHDITQKTIDIYDQYLNVFIPISMMDNNNDADIVINNSDKKNIVYLNKPRDLENFSKVLANKLPKIECDILTKAAEDIREFVHQDYKLSDVLEKGIIYHHGSVPESVRYFIEDLYESNPKLAYLVANSTLLEGVNLPAIKMFILDPRRGLGTFTPSTFKNLIGRVCRFNEIFNPETGSLDYLTPEIHIVKGQYYPQKMTKHSLISKIGASVSKNIVDHNYNPLLVEGEASEEVIKESKELITNILSVNELQFNEALKAKTPFGLSCFRNNIRSIDILDVENDLMLLTLGIEEKVSDINELFIVLNELFFKNTKENAHDNIKRLKEPKARKFYIMILNWRMNGKTLSYMVDRMISYWNSLHEDELVYVGIKWGNLKRGGFLKLWRKISNDTVQEKINLAIVRLKEEFDFVDNEILKFVEVLKDLSIIEENLYLKIRYGTSDETKIKLLNSGLSGYLVDLVIEKYPEYLITSLSDTVFLSKDLIKKMTEEKENGILVTEVKHNSM